MSRVVVSLCLAVAFGCSDSTGPGRPFGAWAVPTATSTLPGPIAAYLTPLGDSVIVANDRDSGRELWRRAIPAAVGCPRHCGGVSLIDAVGDMLLLRRKSYDVAGLLRVRADGTIIATTLPQDAVTGSYRPEFAKRSSATSPLVIATSRALTSLDVSTGVPAWQVRFDTLDKGALRDITRLQFTVDGRYITVRLFDITAAEARPVREIVFRSSDGRRVRDRSLTEGEAVEYVDGPCGLTGRVRVLHDLRIEYTDIATGRTDTSTPIASLSALRDTPTATGLIRASWITTQTHIVYFTPVIRRLF